MDHSNTSFFVRSEEKLNGLLSKVSTKLRGQLTFMSGLIIISLIIRNNVDQ
jgi:hypothetical protein